MLNIKAIFFALLIMAAIVLPVDPDRLKPSLPADSLVFRKSVRSNPFFHSPDPGIMHKPDPRIDAKISIMNADNRMDPGISIMPTIDSFTAGPLRKYPPLPHHPFKRP